MKQEMMSGSNNSWTYIYATPRSRQINRPVPH